MNRNQWIFQFRSWRTSCQMCTCQGKSRQGEWDTTTELFLAGCHSCCKSKWVQTATGWINWQNINSSYWMQILHLLMLSQRWLKAGTALWGRLVFAYLVIITTTTRDHMKNQTVWSQPVLTSNLCCSWNEMNNCGFFHLFCSSQTALGLGVSTWEIHFEGIQKFF